MRVVVAAIKEEAFPEIEQHGASAVYWLSLGELSKLIETFKRENITRAIMAGQVKHRQIFSSIKPDWRLAKLLLSLTTRNTDSLIGAVSKVLADEGITLMNSTELLEPMLAAEGVLTRRAPSDSERTNITYGHAVADHLSRFDIGQTVVIAEAACIAVEAMEGTDATILRAGEIMKSPALGKEPSTLSRALTVVKVAKPNQDMRFDVPVVGLRTIETMKQAGPHAWRWTRDDACCWTKKPCWRPRTMRGFASSPRRRSTTFRITAVKTCEAVPRGVNSSAVAGRRSHNKESRDPKRQPATETRQLTTLRAAV